MLQEFFEALCERAKLNPVTAPIPNGPKTSYLIRQADGSYEAQEIPAEPRDHAAGNVRTVTELARRFFERDEETGEPSAALWFSRQSVIGVLQESDRRDTVTLSIGLSPQIEALQKLEANKRAFKQQELIFFLRTTFADCLDRCDQLIPILRQLRFAGTKEAAGDVQHGRASIGRTLTAEVTGLSAIPEAFELYVPLFACRTLPPWREAVNLALEPDPTTETFQLIPLPLSIETAIARGEEVLGELVNKSANEGIDDEAQLIPVYFGTP